MATLITASDDRYWTVIRPYLESLDRHCQLPVVLIGVGSAPRSPIPPRIKTVVLPIEANAGAPPETQSPQHGSFLQVLDISDDETIVFTDGDIIMQRPFELDELEMFDNLDGSTVMAGYNSGPGETLAIEGARLYPRVPMSQIEQLLGRLDRPCYNVGVFVARAGTYRAIYAEYMRRWNTVSSLFAHPARQQWLMVYTIHALGLRVQVTPYSLHANGHYGMPPGCGYWDGQLRCGGDVVALRHKL